MGNLFKSKLVGVLLVVIGLAAIYWHLPVHSYLTVDLIIRTVDRIKGHPWAPVLFTAIYTASSLFAPLSIFPVAGGVLFGFWKGLILNTLAANLGAWITYFIARKFGRRIVRRFLKGSLKKFDDRLSKNGAWAIFSIRLIGFPPFLITNYTAGLSGISTRDYVLGSFLGMLTWTVALTYFSNTFWKIFITSGTEGFKKAVSDFSGPILIGVAILGCVAGMAAFLRKKMKVQGIGE